MVLTVGTLAAWLFGAFVVSVAFVVFLHHAVKHSLFKFVDTQNLFLGQEFTVLFVEFGADVKHLALMVKSGFVFFFCLIFSHVSKFRAIEAGAPYRPHLFLIFKICIGEFFCEFIVEFQLFRYFGSLCFRKGFTFFRIRLLFLLGECCSGYDSKDSYHKQFY